MRWPERKAGPSRSGGALGAALGAVILLQGCSLLPQTEPSPPPPSIKPAAVIAPEPETTGPVEIKAAQRALLELGYYEAGVDGIVGPKTEAAIRAFQKASNLQITGDLTRELVDTIVNSAAGARQRLSSFTGLAQPVYEAGDRFHY